MLMTEKFVKLFFTVMVLSGIVYLSDTGAAEWVHVSGKVTSDYGTPLCAMVLANGQHMFSCGEDLGSYDLNVLPDENGAVNLLAFCDGFAPFRKTLYPGGTGQVYNITMTAASGNSPQIAVTCQMGTASGHPGWIKITGEVRDKNGTMLCAMVLANGQHTFTCGSPGKFGLEVSPDALGEITLFVFCDGFAPFRQIMNVSGLKMNKKASDSLPEGATAVSSEIIITQDGRTFQFVRFTDSEGNPGSVWLDSSGNPVSERDLPPAEERSSIDSRLSYILGREPSDPDYIEDDEVLDVYVGLRAEDVPCDIPPEQVEWAGGVLTVNGEILAGKEEIDAYIKKRAEQIAECGEAMDESRRSVLRELADRNGFYDVPGFQEALDNGRASVKIPMKKGEITAFVKKNSDIAAGVELYVEPHDLGDAVVATDMDSEGNPVISDSSEFSNCLRDTPEGWVEISGAVRTENQTPLCSMVLANGQYMFTSKDSGLYALNVPPDENGVVTLFAFCDGFAPFKKVINPSESYDFDITMSPAPADSPVMNVTHSTDSVNVIYSGWVKISGQVFNADGTPLCAMILANGQHMFTCGENEGKYELEVPLDANGEITLFGFCDGLQPFKEILKP